MRSTARRSGRRGSGDSDSDLVIATRRLVVRGQHADVDAPAQESGGSRRGGDPILGPADAGDRVEGGERAVRHDVIGRRRCVTNVPDEDRVRQRSGGTARDSHVLDVVYELADGHGRTTRHDGDRPDVGDGVCLVRVGLGGVVGVDRDGLRARPDPGLGRVELVIVIRVAGRPGERAAGGRVGTRDLVGQRDAGERHVALVCHGVGVVHEAAADRQGRLVG